MNVMLAKTTTATAVPVAIRPQSKSLNASEYPVVIDPVFSTVSGSFSKLRFYKKPSGSGSCSCLNRMTVQTLHKRANAPHWHAIHFYTCREDFHKASARIKQMLFVHAPGGDPEAVTQGRHVADFINRIEDMVGATPHCEFFSTSRDNVLFIEVSPWWANKPMRRSLFTALLRSGREYRNPNCFELALWSCKYLYETKIAVERFLQGHTHYTGRVCGWWNQFVRYGSHRTWQRPTKKLEELLVMP